MKRISKKRLFLPVILAGTVCLGVFSLPVAAQEVHRLSLAETVERGLQNSKEQKISLSMAREADAALKEARESRLPDLDLSGRYMRLASTADVRLQTGKDENDAPGGENGSEGEDAPASPDYLMLGQASLSLPLFSGFRLNHAIRSAGYLQKAARLDAEASKSEVILNLAAAWSNLFKAQSAVQLVEENLEQATQRVRDFSNLEKNGLLARNDLLKARLQESDVKLTLLEAENNLEITAYNMGLLLGFPEGTVLRADTVLPGEPPRQVSLGVLEEQALSGRKDLASTGWKAEAASEEIKVAAGERWPTVGLSAGYIAADLHHVLTVTNAVNAGLGISFNLASLYKAGSKIAQAKERAARLDLAREQLSDEVKMQVHRAFNAYELSLKKTEVYREALQQAAENYRITKNKYDNSLASTTDLLDADVAHLKARIDASYARADAVVAWYSLLKAAGQLGSETINHL